MRLSISNIDVYNHLDLPFEIKHCANIYRFQRINKAFIVFYKKKHIYLMYFYIFPCFIAYSPNFREYRYKGGWECYLFNIL